MSGSVQTDDKVVEVKTCSEQATIRMADRLAAALGPADCICLSGPVGAGKTVFARAMVQHLLARGRRPVEDVPSPSFTLVQTYDAGAFEVWHVDLYRLSDPDEVLELGLDAAFDTAVTLIEWPGILGALLPSRRLEISFQVDAHEERTRHITFAFLGGGWNRACVAMLQKDRQA